MWMQSEIRLMCGKVLMAFTHYCYILFIIITVIFLECVTFIFNSWTKKYYYVAYFFFY